MSEGIKQHQRRRDVRSTRVVNSKDTSQLRQNAHGQVTRRLTTCDEIALSRAIGLLILSVNRVVA